MSFIKSINKEKKNIKNIIIYSGIILIGFLLGMVLLNNTHFSLTNDDAVYKNSINQWGSWWNWLINYYSLNSGRVLIHSLLIFFLNLPHIVWKIVSALMVSFTSLMFYKYASLFLNDEKNIVKNIFLAICSIGVLLLIPGSTIDGSIRWASGSLNYLYPVCCLLVSLYPFALIIKKRKISAFVKICSVFSVILCSNMEQSSAVFIAFGLMVYVYVFFIDKSLWDRISNFDKKFFIMLWFVSLIIALFGYCSPGNVIRAQDEVLRWYGYNMYSIFDKFILGIQLFITYMFSFRGLVIWLMPSAILLILNIKNKEYRRIFLPLLNILLSVIQNIIIRKFINSDFLFPYDILHLVWLIFSISILVFNGVIIVSIFTWDSEKYFNMFIYMAAVFSGIVPCFAPTLYVSTYRTIYITYIFLFLVIINSLTAVCSFRDSKKSQDISSKGLRKVILCIVLTFSLVISVIPLLESNFINSILVNGNVSDKYKIHNVSINKDTINVVMYSKDFQYETDNWCNGKGLGYDFNVQLGVYDEQNSRFNARKTYIITDYPALPEYKNKYVEFSAKISKNDFENGKLMLMVTDHHGKEFFNFIDEN